MDKILFFIGKSGVGKTSLMDKLVCINDLFFMPTITVTRNLRFDDNSELISRVSVEEFIAKRKAKNFVVSFDDGKNYYGYNKFHLHRNGKINLMYGSPYALNKIKRCGSVILIDGDADKGLFLRYQNFRLMMSRQKINYELSRRFYENDDFRNSIDIIFYNNFSCLDSLTKQLNHLILQNKKA